MTGGIMAILLPTFKASRAFVADHRQSTQLDMPRPAKHAAQAPPAAHVTAQAATAPAHAFFLRVLQLCSATLAASTFMLARVLVLLTARVGVVARIADGSAIRLSSVASVVFNDRNTAASGSRSWETR